MLMEHSMIPNSRPTNHSIFHSIIRSRVSNLWCWCVSASELWNTRRFNFFSPNRNWS